MHKFQEAWNRFHAGRFPVGFRLREADTPNWLRFHSLPLSKRYADTDAERKLLLARHNELAGEVLGADEACWLVQVYFEPENDPNIIDIARRDHGLPWAFKFFTDDDAEEEWQVAAGETSWAVGKFDDLIWAIANEQSASTLWMSASTGSIFAPYDGGIDLFLPNPKAVCDLRARHQDWISAHPDGL